MSVAKATVRTELLTEMQGYHPEGKMLDLRRHAPTPTAAIGPEAARLSARRECRLRHHRSYRDRP